MFIFYKVFFPLKQKNIFIFLNNCELRGGGGFITHQLEICFFLGIPYKIRNINFLDINNYTIQSFEPFFSNLSKKMSFRDCNYSIFNEENFKRLSMFSEKSLGYKPQNIILFNFSFIEKIFPPISLSFKGFSFNRNTLFRNLSHITSDTLDGKYNRKNIILKFGVKIIGYIILIPFYPHYILILIIQNINNKNFFILNNDFKDIPKGTYIGIEENNLIGRKGNRYLSNDTQYNFYIEELQDGCIYGKGMIKVLKTLFADESFPISGVYKANIEGVFSEGFEYQHNKDLLSIKNGQSLFYEIPFTFRLPKKGTITIIKGPGTLHNNISIAFQTKIFHLLPETSLTYKEDHLEREFRELSNDFSFSYNISLDSSALKFQSKKIIQDGLISIAFNKELINLDINNFDLVYNGNNISIEKIEKKGELKNIIYLYYKKGSIDKYDFKIDLEHAYLECKKLQDRCNIIHYQNGRKFKLIW